MMMFCQMKHLTKSVKEEDRERVITLCTISQQLMHCIPI